MHVHYRVGNDSDFSYLSLPSYVGRLYFGFLAIAWCFGSVTPPSAAAASSAPSASGSRVEPEDVGGAKVAA